MELTVTAAVLSVCCLCAIAAPQARLPWQQLSAASSIYRKTDDILRFEPMTSVDSVWETFKAEHSMRLFHVACMLRVPLRAQVCTSVKGSFLAHWSRLAACFY